jgi:hypothetical protein
VPREQAREEITTHLNETHAGVNGKQVQGNDVGEPPPEPIYRECYRCKNCPECHGTQSVRVN